MDVAIVKSSVMPTMATTTEDTLSSEDVIFAFMYNNNNIYIIYG